MKPKPRSDGKPDSKTREIDVFTAHLAIIDFIDNEMPKLGSLAELRTALVIWRKTHGWGKATDSITSSQLAALTGSGRGGIRRARKKLTEKAGIAIDQELDPAGDLGRSRYTWPINDRVRTTLEKAAKAKGGGGCESHPTPGVENAPTGGCESHPTQSSISQSAVLSQSCKSRVKADIQPPRRKSGDTPAVGRPRATEQPKIESLKADASPVKPAEEKTLPVEKEKAEAFRDDWTDEELEACEELLTDNLPTNSETWEDDNCGGAGGWAIEATLNAGGGLAAAEVIDFLRAKIADGWTPSSWKAWPAVVRHEFERRRRRAEGIHWSGSDLAKVRQKIAAYMGDTPPEAFENSIELDAEGATAEEVCGLLDRKFANKKYRPGGKCGPRKWNWFHKVIRNEFSETERSHQAEQPAAPRSEHRVTPEAFDRGLEVLEDLVSSYRCKCGAEIRQYASRVVGTCTCSRVVNRKQPGIVHAAEVTGRAARR